MDIFLLSVRFLSPTCVSRVSFLSYFHFSLIFILKQPVGFVGLFLLLVCKSLNYLECLKFYPNVVCCLLSCDLGLHSQALLPIFPRGANVPTKGDSARMSSKGFGDFPGMTLLCDGTHSRDITERPA